MLYVTAKRINIKLEQVYLKFGKRQIEPEPTDEGRLQFFEFESLGKIPEKPDSYYLRLSEGRKWMDWMRNELKDGYQSWVRKDPGWEDKWFGWYQLKLDWKGEIHILKLLLNWCKTIPEGFFNDDI